ncbi:SRPBCC family protein [Phenylobacterium sp.]|uniref:SRPBCC family protein n=1 Tax=Phenylobacterium sp. TaxID=1871053 RepID=UPI00289B5176|nr:SRPBCC family protein [Phenylobacterium sp.]
MLTTLVAILILAVLGLVAYAANHPGDFRVERTATVRAAPETLYDLIEDFHRWTAWSPYENIDADLKRTYAGAERGVGAIYGWEGRKTGVGRMAITEAVRPSQVLIELIFLKPFQAHNTAEFTLEPTGEATKVTWAMSGHNGLFAKLISLFFSMDKMVGPQFEQGLAKLKALAEREGSE